MGQLLVRF